jgi:hypothetical protein
VQSVSLSLSLFFSGVAVAVDAFLPLNFFRGYSDDNVFKVSPERLLSLDGS